MQITYEDGRQDALSGYYASKTLAEKAAWDFSRDKKPTFSLTTLCPSMVCGNLTLETDDSLNGRVFQVLGVPEQEITSLSKLNFSAGYMYDIFAGKSKNPETYTWLWIDVRDVALALVVAAVSDIHSQSCFC